LRLHLEPKLGKLSLTKLSTQHLQNLYADRLDAGLSPTTVHHLHATTHRALEQAVRQGLVARNVADLVDPLRIARHEIRTLSPDEANRLIDLIRTA
jgi:integrase